MARKSVTLSTPPWNGDHGPDTAAQRTGTTLVEPEALRGNNPNRIATKRRENVLRRMHMQDGSLTMRQYQAGVEIQEAHEECEALSSGGPLKEQVDCTPVPDRFIERQVDAQSRLKVAMGSIPNNMRLSVEVVCWYNLPLSSYTTRRAEREAELKDLQAALDMSADGLGY
ncbi:MAG: hypothetical protein COB08_019405 [Rhodobacteraceae bacterium]|nr:hypothetical protein [Paracoccaceae bacterium]